MPTLRPHFLALCWLLLPLLSPAAEAPDARRPYVVGLADLPIASYRGGIAGLSATQPRPGTRLNLAAREVRLYSDYLARKQADVQAIVAAAPVQYRYKVVFNGFAARLTEAEVRRLQASADVASITPDQPRHMVTNYTPTFLGLDLPDGLWNRLGGKERAGEDVIVGIVDGGIWPENPSFADRVDANGTPTFAPGARLAYDAPPAGWNGTCQGGEAFDPARHCNNKLIGAQYFEASYRAEPGKSTHWSDFRSPRDSIGGSLGHGGHGTHTSSTAAGNYGVPANVAGIPLGTVSGMAPHARVAMYKVCWSYNDDGDPTGASNECWTGDSVAAIEKAARDGVHVINYSISGGTSIDDPVEQAFLHASNAGIFVAASAGNNGPGNAVAHISPWLTTVAASTHDRLLQATLTLGNGARYIGASLNVTPLPPSPLIRAEDAGLPGADAGLLALCYSAADNDNRALLDPAKAAGKIVVCMRGGNARVDKSRAVKEAGGIGMVLVDNGAGLVADVHAVPSVHVSADDGAAIRAYAQTAGASAALSHFVIGRSGLPAPVMATFSSRGPNRFDSNVLKPDLTAPGVDILAGVTPELTPAQRAELVNGSLIPPAAWDFYQGTSMATPHVTGVAALLRQQHPDWSPSAIKSALMTSASPTYPDTESGAAAGILPWAQGAGHLTPNAAADPGLVYDVALNDYRKYMCGAGIATECGAGSMAGYELNLPSITLNNVLGTQTLTRTVRNVGAAPATYTASASIDGYSVNVEPSSLTLAPGESKSFSVTLTRGAAPDNAWQFGALEWSDGAHTVRSPLQARSGPAVAAPALVRSDRVSALRLLSVSTAFSGKLGTATGGLKEVSRTALTVTQAPPGSVDTLEQVVAACQAGAAGVRVVPFAFPDNTVVARFETFDRDTDDGGGQDIDMAVLDSAGELVGYSLHQGSNEAVTLASPAPGDYRVCLIGYAVANGVATGATLSWAVVSRADSGGRLSVSTPSKVYAGGAATVGVSWSGLALGTCYLGGVQFLDQEHRPAATTVVSVETNSPAPLAAPLDRAVKNERGL